ncbi:Uncharacterised protein [Achromobacter kerstersii]|nr:Uncharacterised protein [Achromobacter kerstersii]
MATSAVPKLWPNTRVVACKPPAAPLRERGAADNMARLFGVWKKPNPTPATNMPATMGQFDTDDGSRASDSMPATMVAAPTPLSVAAE